MEFSTVQFPKRIIVGNGRARRKARNLKRIAVIAAFLAVAAHAADCEPAQRLSLAMTSLNATKPFVSRGFAERLALLIIDDRYPKDIFLAAGSAHVEDKGELWIVSFENTLRSATDSSPMPWAKDGKLAPRRVTITIRKANGEIVDFP